MGRFAKRMPFSEFEAPPKELIEKLDLSKRAIVLSKSGVVTGEQIEELFEIWYNFAFAQVKYSNELQVSQYNQKSKKVMECVIKLSEEIIEPANLAEIHLASNLSNSLKAADINTSIQDILIALVEGVAVEIRESKTKGLPRGHALEELFKSMLVFCKKHNFYYGAFDANNFPSKLAEFIFETLNLLSKQFSFDRPASPGAIAGQLKRIKQAENSK